MDPICARVRAQNTPIALALCVRVSADPCGLSCGAGSSQAAPPRPAVLHRPGALRPREQSRGSGSARGSAFGGRSAPGIEGDISGCPSAAPRVPGRRVFARTSEARSVIFCTGETLPNCYLQPHNNPLK